MEPLNAQSRASLAFVREWFLRRGRVVDEAAIIRAALDHLAASLRAVDGLARAGTAVQDADDDEAEEAGGGGWSL